MSSLNNNFFYFYKTEHSVNRNKQKRQLLKKNTNPNKTKNPKIKPLFLQSVLKLVVLALTKAHPAHSQKKCHKVVKEFCNWLIKHCLK